MAKISEKRRAPCEKKHVGAFVLKWDDGSFTVKCGFLKQGADSCPFLKDADYRSQFRRVPKYEPE